MSPERYVITTPGKREHSGVFLADAMAKVGFSIKVSDDFEIIGGKKTRDIFFDLSSSPEMTMVFWAIGGLDEKSLSYPSFEDDANFPFQTKRKIESLSFKEIFRKKEKISRTYARRRYRLPSRTC